MTRFPYEIARLAQDISGGLMVTTPYAQELNNPITEPYIKKYLSATSAFSVEDRIKIIRLIENLTLGSAAVGYLTESMHGAGSPQAQRIMISKHGNLESKKNMAKSIANINS